MTAHSVKPAVQQGFGQGPNNLLLKQVETVGCTKLLYGAQATGSIATSKGVSNSDRVRVRTAGGSEQTSARVCPGPGAAHCVHSWSGCWHRKLLKQATDDTVLGRSGKTLECVRAVQTDINKLES